MTGSYRVAGEDLPYEAGDLSRQTLRDELIIDLKRRERIAHRFSVHQLIALLVGLCETFRAIGRLK